MAAAIACASHDIASPELRLEWKLIIAEVEKLKHL
jgi:hypothetical protein